MKSLSAWLTLPLAFVAASASAQRVPNGWDAVAPFGDDTFLISEVRGAYIAYEFIPALNDWEFVQKVDWKDRNGTTLLRGASSRFFVIFTPYPPGTVTTTTWSRYLGQLSTAPVEQVGTAD